MDADFARTINTKKELLHGVVQSTIRFEEANRHNQQAPKYMQKVQPRDYIKVCVAIVTH